MTFLRGAALAAAVVVSTGLAGCAGKSGAAKTGGAPSGENYSGGAATAAAAQTPKKQAVNEYHGIKVTDPYQWLENWDDPAVKAWSESQNTRAVAFLERQPARESIRKRITALTEAESVKFSHLAWEGGQLFALKNQPPKQQPFLVVMPSPEKPDAARTVVDPNVINAKGTTAIDWFVPSRDGKLVAVSMSDGGSESGDVHVYDTGTGSQIDVVIPRVNGGTAGGDLTWAGDGSGFYYTRYPRGKERPEADMDFYMQVYFHKLGTPTEQDRYEIGKDFPRIAEIMLDTSDDGRYVLASVQNGDGGEFSHSVRSADGKWTQLTGFPDKIVSMSLGFHDDVFMVSRAGSPMGRVLRMPLATPSLKDAAVIVPEDPKASISTSFSDNIGIVVTKQKLYLIDQVGGPNRVWVFDHAGKAQPAPTILAVSAVEQIVPTEQDDVLLLNESFIAPPAWYRFKAASGDTVRTPMATTSPADFSDCDVVREMATSKDGTKVPMTILRRKGTKLDGKNPTLLWGYGGYGVNIEPAFRPNRRVWLEQGGVYAVANIRGGGEMGEAWHTAGNLLNKQNVFDDFHACAMRLVELGYTSRDKLALMGGSNGGLLMGAMITQHPDLAKAVVSQVGIYDMLRVELSPNGAFNVTEFGTVKDPAQFKALYAYSPYHHVTDGTKYPAILMFTGANDPRVDPMHSRKMIARLQEANSSPEPILLRTSSDSGHGIGSSLAQRVEQDVSVYSFLMGELGVAYRAQ